MTIWEFSRLCEQNRKAFSLRFPVETVQPFLDRCCEVGLLTKETDAGGVTRYAPTPELIRALG